VSQKARERASTNIRLLSLSLNPFIVTSWRARQLSHLRGFFSPQNSPASKLPSLHRARGILLKPQNVPHIRECASALPLSCIQIRGAQSEVVSSFSTTSRHTTTFLTWDALLFAPTHCSFETVSWRQKLSAFSTNSSTLSTQTPKFANKNSFTFAGNFQIVIKIWILDSIPLLDLYFGLYS
jgi:hypothetical protein